MAYIREIISTAIGAEAATRVYEGQKRFDLILRYPKTYRDSVETISNILLTTATGALIPLGELAKIELREGPALISREGLQRRIYVGFNTLGRDIESIVVEAQAKIAKQVQLPPGYHLIWGGSFENMQRAMSRLKIIVPITIGLIFLLLFASFNSVRHAALIILNLPFALIGGIVSLWITGEYLSVPASVGFINLFGVAVLNGIVLVSYINQLRAEGLADDQAIVRGCLLRLRPVLMTALVAMLGLIPLAFSHGIGSEVQRPLAVVVIGGLVSSTLLTLIVLPTLYGCSQKRSSRRPPRTFGHLRARDSPFGPTSQPPTIRLPAADSLSQTATFCPRKNSDGSPWLTALLVLLTKSDGCRPTHFHPRMIRGMRKWRCICQRPRQTITLGFGSGIRQEHEGVIG